MAKRKRASTPRPTLTVTPEHLDERLIARLYRLATFLVNGQEVAIDAPASYTSADAEQLVALAPHIAARQREQLIALVEQLVPKPLRQAVLARESLTNRWPLPPRLGDGPEADEAAAVIARACEAWQRLRSAPAGDLRPDTYPLDVALVPALEWARNRAIGALRRELATVAHQFSVGITGSGSITTAPARVTGRGVVGRAAPVAPADAVTPADSTPTTTAASPIPAPRQVPVPAPVFTPIEPERPAWSRWIGAVLVYAAYEEVARDRTKPFFAVDASAPHTALLNGMTEFVRTSADLSLSVNVGRIELLAPGHIVQLAFNYDGEVLSEAVVELIQKLMGPRAVRHYTALLARLTTDGNRTGRVPWRVDAHLRMLGVDPKEYRHEAAEAIATMREFTRLEVALYDKKDQVRVRQPLIAVVGEVDVRDIEDHWELGGLVLQYASSLYEGVRKPNGRIGTNWYPASPHLAAINEKRYPFASLMGLKLATRLRRAMMDGQHFIRLSGQNMLEFAGITLSRNDPARAWESLTKNLNVLMPHSLKHWEWTRNPNTLDGVIELVAPDWATDRTLRGVKHKELPAPVVPLVGADLRKWRTERELSLEQAAHRLGVGKNTIYRAEQAPEKPLSTRLKTKFLEP